MAKGLSNTIIMELRRLYCWKKYSLIILDGIQNSNGVREVKGWCGKFLSLASANFHQLSGRINYLTCSPRPKYESGRFQNLANAGRITGWAHQGLYTDANAHGHRDGRYIYRSGFIHTFWKTIWIWRAHLRPSFRLYIRGYLHCIR